MQNCEKDANLVKTSQKYPFYLRTAEKTVRQKVEKKRKKVSNFVKKSQKRSKFCQKMLILPIDRKKTKIFAKTTCPVAWFNC